MFPCFQPEIRCDFHPLRQAAGAEPSLPHRKDCEALLGGSSVEQVVAVQMQALGLGSCEKSWAFASRLNSMKERQGDFPVRNRGPEPVMVKWI